MTQPATFVFTDLVGSVALKQRMPGADAAARDEAYLRLVLGPHRERIEAGLADAGGRVVSTAGDGHFLVFADPVRAARWTIDVVRSHKDQPIASGSEGEADRVVVRIGMHTGSPQIDPADSDNFVGRAVDYAARLGEIAQGGQVLVSKAAASLIEDGGLTDVRVHRHAPRGLRGIGEVEVFELLPTDRQPAPPRETPTDDAAREWSVLPATMSLTEYTAQSDSPAGSSATAVAGSSTRSRQIGNYQLGELLGAGGMGAVYKARHSQFDRPRALKLIRPELVASGGDSVVQRFYQEVRATGALEHPNLVVAIDSSAPNDDEHYLVMEFIDGVSVERFIEAGRRLPIAEACEIARQAALGLEHLRERGLVHRDVKPSNLMVTLVEARDLPGATSGSRRGREKLPVVKLMDLGLALLCRGDEERLTRLDRGGGMGTGYYMSPEQWRTTSVDTRADIYSLGCTLFHLLTGAPPFANSDLRPDKAHEIEPPPRLDLPGGTPPVLAELVRRMLAKRPEDRPQTPLEVAEALEPFAADSRLPKLVASLLDGSGVASRVETQAGPAAAGIDTDVARLGSLHGSGSMASTPTQRRNWMPTIVATAVACAAVLALAIVVNRSREARSEDRQKQLASSAGLAAINMADAIEKRVQALGSLSDNRELRRWLIAVDEDRDNESLWDPVQSWLTEVSGRYESNFHSSSWFVTDAKGRQIARAPPKQSIGNSYAHRDYFHGEGRDLSEDPPPDTEPIREPHRSAVYRSSTSQRLKVAFSTPVFNGARKSDERRPVGVLAMSVELGEFAEFDAIERRIEPIEILLADVGDDFVDGKLNQGLVLHHRDLQRQTPPNGSIRLDGRVLDAALTGAGGGPLGEYPDVLGRGDSTYRGAFATVVAKSLPAGRRAGWIVIAQEPAD